MNDITNAGEKNGGHSSPVTMPVTAGGGIPLASPAVSNVTPAVATSALAVFNDTGPRHGVPSSPEGYNLHSLGVFGAEDRPLIDYATRECHAAAVPQHIFQAAMRAALRATSWEAIEDAIIDAGGRNSDCDLAMKIMRKIINGGGVGGSMPKPSADAQRMEEIRTIMRTDNRRYWKDESLQSEYRQLLAKAGK